MLIKSIKLNNIRSYVNEEINFPTGSTLLAGDIGTGKSSVLMALDFALFGTRRGELGGESILRHGSNTGYVDLEFELDGKEILVHRSLKRGKNDSVSQDSGYIKIDGVIDHGSATEIKAKVLDILGYPQEFITKNPIIFRYTVYTPQEEMKRIFLDPTERLQTIRKIFGIDKYGRIRENTKIILTELRSIKRSLELAVLDLNEKMDELEEKKRQKIEISTNLEENRRKLDIINHEMAGLTDESTKISKKLEEANKIRQQLKVSESQLKMKNERMPRIEREMRELDTKIIELSKALGGQLIKPTNISEIDIKNKIHQLENIRRDLISNESSLSQEIMKLEGILRDGFCGFCEQPVMNKENFREKIEQKTAIRGKTIDDSVRNESEIDKLRKIQDELARYNSEYQKRSFIEKNYIEKIEIKKRYEDETEAVLSDIKNLEEEFRTLENELLGFANLEESKTKIERQLEETRNKKLALASNISRMEQQNYHLESEINALERDIREKTKYKEKINYIGEINNWLDSFFVNLMETIEKHVLITIQKEFNEFFQNWFNILVPDEMLSVRIDEQFSPLIEQNSYETSYDNLSGGEKTSVALSYRLALNKVINTTIEGIKTKNIIILDEPTDGFSSEQLDRIRDVLAELNLKQMIIVSHEQKIDTFVDNVIRFYKEHHVTRVEQ